MEAPAGRGALADAVSGGAAGLAGGAGGDEAHAVKDTERAREANDGGFRIAERNVPRASRGGAAAPRAL